MKAQISPAYPAPLTAFIATIMVMDIVLPAHQTIIER